MSRITDRLQDMAALIDRKWLRQEDPHIAALLKVSARVFKSIEGYTFINPETKNAVEALESICPARPAPTLGSIAREWVRERGRLNCESQVDDAINRMTAAELVSLFSDAHIELQRLTK